MAAWPPAAAAAALEAVEVLAWQAEQGLVLQEQQPACHMRQQVDCVMMMVTAAGVAVG